MTFTTFGTPPPSSPKFTLSTFNGCTLIIAVGGCHPSFQTQYRVAPAVRGAVVVLNGEHAGEEFHDVLLFNTRVVRQLRGIPGQAILALVNVDTAAQDAVELLNPTDDMREYANKWADANPGKVDAMIKTSVEAFQSAEAATANAAPQPYAPRSFPAPRQAPPPPPRHFSDEAPF